MQLGSPKRLLGSLSCAFDGSMAPCEAREEQARLNTRFASTLVIAAAIIVAVRLARDDISEPTLRVRTEIGQSISLARLILTEVLRCCPVT